MSVRNGSAVWSRTGEMMEDSVRDIISWQLFNGAMHVVRSLYVCSAVGTDPMELRTVQWCSHGSM